MNNNHTLSGLPKLSGEYNQGYTKALQDIIEISEYIVPDLKYHHKSLNAKMIQKLLKCCLDNREKLRENFDKEGFIRYNGQKEDFEFFRPENRR